MSHAQPRAPHPQPGRPRPAAPTRAARRPLAALLALAGLAMLAGCTSRGPASARPGASTGASPSLEGRYELAWRELPDGRVVRPPEVLGAMDISATRRNLNVSWLKDGQRHALALVSHWRIEGERLYETSVYRLTDFAGQGVTYRTEPVSGSSPVHREPGVLRVQMPLDGEPEVEVRADGLTSRKPGAFVDHWRRLP